MKYLIMEDFSGQPIPFIFPRRVNHEDMREQLPYAKVISSGFIEFHDDTLMCYDNSTAAHEPKPDDAKIIKNCLRRK